MPYDGGTAAPITTAIRTLLGPNGEGWCRHRLIDTYWSRTRHCLLGAWGQACKNNWGAAHFTLLPEPMIDAARKLNPGFKGMSAADAVATYNNRAKSFLDIKRFLDVMEEYEASANTPELLAA